MKKVNRNLGNNCVVFVGSINAQLFRTDKFHSCSHRLTTEQEQLCFLVLGLLKAKDKKKMEAARFIFH